MYKNLKIPAVECLKNENYHEYRKLLHEKTTFKKKILAPENCKNQEINRKSKIFKQTYDLYHVTITYTPLCSKSQITVFK